MSYRCFIGGGECDGCGLCEDPMPICESCGSEHEWNYKDENGYIIGCENCIAKTSVYEE